MGFGQTALQPTCAPGLSPAASLSSPCPRGRGGEQAGTSGFPGQSRKRVRAAILTSSSFPDSRPLLGTRVSFGNQGRQERPEHAQDARDCPGPADLPSQAPSTPEAAPAPGARLPGPTPGQGQPRRASRQGLLLPAQNRPPGLPGASRGLQQTKTQRPHLARTRGCGRFLETAAGPALWAAVQPRPRDPKLLPSVCGSGSHSAQTGASPQPTAPLAGSARGRVPPELSRCRQEGSPGLQPGPSTGTNVHRRNSNQAKHPAPQGPAGEVIIKARKSPASLPASLVGGLWPADPAAPPPPQAPTAPAPAPARPGGRPHPCPGALGQAGEGDRVHPPMACAHHPPGPAWFNTSQYGSHDLDR